ncbi:hypothetical protein LRH25_01660 [Ideonella azotifigens]|uniref:Tetratricopeptide repeat protein n=1 Tax=Ideonella azotifigens TaxID=513160 RepID=A0ABN1K9P1_9BURK|nr:hypothetical protein [Ideonella azotifigens]MCD2339040.1 hypothetical protein [Ideonella azotifigens]
MASRLIERLDAAIVSADDPVQRECLKAERAGALARHGLLADARFALAGLRTQSQRRRSARLSAWVWLVDGQIDHFEALAPKAKDKFRRSRELAMEAGDTAMQALASAWLASCSWNESSMTQMAGQLLETLQLAAPDHHSARARAGLVLADAYRFAGDDEASQVWYLKARTHASADGDGSMISALLHNISAMRSARIGLDDAFGHTDLDVAAKALLEAESTANYDWGAGAVALTAMVPIQLRAQLLVVLGRFDEAVALFDAYLGRARSEGMAYREPRFLADRAWCHVCSQRLAEGLRDARQAERGLASQFDADDWAATHARLARVFGACQLPDEAAVHQARAEESLALHKVHQQSMRETLATTLREVI